MILGLKRGVVELAEHDPEWEKLAAQTIERLWSVFGSTAEDIQHVGSTAIIGIKAKPIIDIAVGVQSLDSLDDVFLRLEADGFYKSVQHAVPNDILYALGDSDDIARTHHIHIVEIGGLQWKNYTNLRDYLNDCPRKASEYEKVKFEFAEKYPDDRSSYTKGKDVFFETFLLEARMYDEMRQKFDVVNLDPITKGWSEDKKYCVTIADGTKYLLRISPIERYEARKSLFDMLKQVDALSIPMCKPVEFGTCDDGVYSIQSWIDGEDLDVALPLLSETEQYVLGLKSGEIMRKMHSLTAPETREEWEIRFNKKIDRNIALNKKCVEDGFAVDGLELLRDFVQDNRHLLENRPQCFQHGDYHVGNMMLENGELKIIDFDRYDFGDPLEEFNRMTFNAAASPHFATGLLRGYFNGEPPQEFFKLQAFYIASTHLGGLSWARKFGESEIVFTKKQIADILCWFDNMNNPVPTWYLKDFYIQWIDGVPYKLKAPFDFSFFSKYGKVFKVFDGQDSGNICFGVNNNDKRYFIKFAGAPTYEYTGTVESAIERLRAAVSPYKDLAHPNLIHFIKSEEIGDDFAVIFEWVDGICAHPMYPTDYRKFRQLPLVTRLQIYEDILDFHAFVASQDYTAVDFYDGSIMWDISNGRTVICDIDFYTKAKVCGSEFLWGHMQSASPEERTDGAPIDEISNVYNMGETAFTLFIGRKSDRSREAWPLSDSQYAVVKKAVNDERSERQQSIAQFIAEWRAAR